MVKLTDKRLNLQVWVELALDTGKTDLRAMELLDNGNTSHFGHPEPTLVNRWYKAGKAILVTGHDIKDLENLLIQSEGLGINIYTHGEMLPCHGYPGLKKYAHLAGHFGTAWQNQRKNFLASQVTFCSPQTASKIRHQATKTGSSPQASLHGREPPM